MTAADAGSGGPAPEASGPASAADAGSGGRPITVAVADDHPVVRQGLRAFLESEGFVVVGEAATGEEAVRLVADAGPDVLLTDLVMPGVDGVEAIRRIRAAGQGVGILVLTSFSGTEQVIPAIQAGADGYLLKDAGPGTLGDAIRAVHRGERMLAPEAAAAVMAKVAGDGPAAPAAPPPNPELDRLTAREREVLAALGRGLTNRQLARELYISEKTVKTHVSSILAKLRLTDRTQAALYAVRAGLADPRPG
ncbi:MAG TPA: response regulator transcription factor [Acidimicrobiales bacterium]